MYKMKTRRKKMRVLSSSENDSDDGPPSQNKKDSHHEPDIAPQKSHVSGYNSDGNSSVESMDIILYPSASVLSKISNSKLEINEEFKDKNRKSIGGTSKKVKANQTESKEFKNKNRRSIAGTSKEVKVNQTESKNKLNKTVKKVSKDISKSERKLERKNEGRNKTVNNADELSVETKNKNAISITEVNTNPNPPKRPDQPKSSTVKKRPENYGSRLNPLLTDFKSESNNNNKSKEISSRPKNQSQIKYNKTEKNSEIQKHDKISKSQPAKNDSCANLPEVEKGEQSSSSSKDLNHRKLGHYSKLYNKPQISHSEKSKSEREHHETLSRNSLKSKNSKDVYDQNSKSKRAKYSSYTDTIPEIQNEKLSSTKLLNFKDSNSNDKEGHSSKHKNLPQISKEEITPNLENLKTRKEFHETTSQPGESVEPSNNFPNDSDAMDRNTKFYYFHLIKTIVHLDTKWLEEREKGKIKKSPLELNEEFMKLPLYFKNFDSFKRRYLSLLEAEVWEKICQSTKANSNTSKKSFTFSVDSYDYDLKSVGVMRLNCRSAVHVPTESSLVIVRLKLENGQDKSTFGFIKLLGSEINNLHKTNGRRNKVPVKELVFKIFVKPRKAVPKRNIQMEGKFICSLFKETKQAEALYLMEFSPLLKDYLKPSWEIFRTNYNKYNRDFFNVQQNIFDVVRLEINISPSEPKIMLLQGPPGSGKTSAIVSIAFNLLRNKIDPKKILIVAPNHFALDEIGNQLLKLNESFINPVSFVRLGQIENIHHKLLEFSLHRYLEKCRMNRSKISNLKAINKRPSPNDKKSNNFEEQFETIADDENEQQEIYEILNAKSLILTVPEDCWQLYKLKIKFSCCLMDEVNQGTELDTLYPFALDIKKFLLVADYMQLPANVESETFRQLGYQRSVMERFRSYIIKQFSKNPTIVLSQTYRLNSSIASFPFNHFYPNHHYMCTYADNRSIFCPFKPYVVLDDQSHHGTRDSPYTKETGVNCIVSLCFFITHHCNTSSIGIIVPSEEEKQTYRVPIEKFSSSNVEVNTVDKFQGREKTVIILSAYHDSNNVPLRTNYFSEVRKLNVALTRAISSLIICGPLQETMRYDIWSHIVADSQVRKCYFRFRFLSEVPESLILKSLNT